MNLETFFEKFDLFADAPNAVAKMREFVLDLAVTGRLVEPETKWLNRPLKSLASKIGSGATPAGGRASYFSKGIALIRSMNVHFHGFDRTGLVFLSDEQANELSNVVVQPNDVLLNITGASIGRVTTAPSEMAGARVNQHVAIIRPTSELSPAFLATFLASASVQQMIDDIQVGATREALTKGMIEQFQIPLPSLSEQKRIVAKVDELMALCDRLEAQQQERETRRAALARASLARFADAPTPANLNFIFHKSYDIAPADLRKTILTLAVQGLLVHHDRKCDNWETRKLGELTTKIGSGSTPLGGKESYQVEGVPLIRSMNVHFGGFVRKGLVFLSDEQAEKLKNVTVKAHDVLLNITGASIARVATAPRDMEGARVNQHVCIVRPTHELLPEFLEIFLASPVVQNRINDIQVGATREALTKAMIEQFYVPVPSLAEQRRIVAKADELMALVDTLETQLATARTTAEKLMEAVVAELTRSGVMYAPIRNDFPCLSVDQPNLLYRAEGPGAA